MSDTKTPAPVHPLLEGTTPGPWIVRLNKHDECEVHSESGEWIAAVPHQCVSALVPIQEANANLIAMAPTLAAENARLRAALEALVQHSTESHMCYPDCVENAREVLASLTT